MAFVFKPKWVKQGLGAKVIRIIGSEYLKNMDPFLMLDYANIKLPAGFPDHPHRGFQTVSYILSGTTYHEDSKGHRGKVQNGGVQWMTAGKGIIHSQMPGSFDEQAKGFQLWINLRKEDKMAQPKYQQFKGDEFQIIKEEKAKIKIISGQWNGKKGPIVATTPTYYFDIGLEKDGIFEIPIPKRWKSLIFVYEGSVEYQIDGKKSEVDQFSGCVLKKSNNQEILHKFKGSKNSKFILLSGQPINQPIVQYGPFVMNTQEQIQQTFEDYQQAKNGFQSRKHWKSRIQLLSKGKTWEEIWKQ